MAKAAPETKSADETGYGIQYLAEELGKEPHLVRGMLRRSGVNKTDGRYRWPTKAKADEVVKQLTKDAKAAANKEEKTPRKKAA